MIGVVDSLRKEFPDICLLALTAHYPDVSSDSYEDQIRAEIAAKGLGDNVMLITDYLPDETSRAMLRGVDAIVLPYRDTGESSSAALRFLLPLERPIIVTDQPIFADCREWVMPVAPNDSESMQDAIRRVLIDDRFRADLAGRAQAGASRFRWSRIVSDHREIYCAARRAHRQRDPKTDT